MYEPRHIDKRIDRAMWMFIWGVLLWTPALERLVDRAV